MKIVSMLALERKKYQASGSSDCFRKEISICAIAEFKNNYGKHYNFVKFSIDLFTVERANEKLYWCQPSIIRGYDAKEKLYVTIDDEIITAFKKLCEKYQKDCSDKVINFDDSLLFVKSLFAANKFHYNTEGDFFNYDDYDKQITSQLKAVEYNNKKQVKIA